MLVSGMGLRRGPNLTVDTDDCQTAVRRGRWKLVRNGILGPGSENRLQGDDAVFLADLEADPGEKINLSRRQPQLAAELGAEIEKWLVDVRSG